MLQKSLKEKTGVSTMLRVGVSVLLCFTALAVGGVSFAVLASLKQDPKPRPIVERVYSVEVFQVEEETELQEIITGFGTTKADREVVVKSEVTGRIVDTPVNLKVGQKVYPSGQSTASTSHLLIRIEQRYYRAKVAQIQASISEKDEQIAGLRVEYFNNEEVLKQALIKKNIYQVNHDSIEAAFKKNAVNESEWIQAQLELQRLQEAITDAKGKQARFPTRKSELEKQKETKQAELEIAQLELDHCDIAAPFEGYISESMVEKGQSIRTGDPLVRITDSSFVEIPIGISVDEYESIREDIERSLNSAGSQPMLVRIANDETSKTYRLGYLVRVSPKAEESTRTVELFVRVSNNLANLYADEKKSKILPGRFVHVRIDGPMQRRILVVPRDAIVNDKVFVATDFKPIKDEEGMFEATVEEREIFIDKKFNSLASIKSGISSNDLVILTNLDIISAGVKIRFNGKKVRNLDQELKSGFSRLVRPKPNVSHNTPRRVSN